MIRIRKVYSIAELIAYCESVDFLITEKEIAAQISKREIPHLRPASHLLVFNLDHIDWWISQRRMTSDYPETLS